jgi:hypothetical protein
MRIAPVALTAVALWFGPSIAAAPVPPASAADPPATTGGGDVRADATAGPTPKAAADAPAASSGEPSPATVSPDTNNVARPGSCGAACPTGASPDAAAAPVELERRRRPAPPPRLDRDLVEGGVHLGTTLVPIFQRRWLLGAEVGLRLSDGVAIELTGSISPHFGQGDWTATTRTMIMVYRVSPDLTYVRSTYSALARVSPIHGSVGPNDGALFDAYAIFGAGLASYQPDLTLLGCDTGPCSPNRTAPTTVLGAGVMVGRRHTIATRVELRVTSMAMTTAPGTPLRRDDCELRVGASWGGRSRRGPR